jgi:selenophosphate synthetase-related protein
MSEKILDLSQTVYALCARDPEIAEILAEAGFRDITRPGMLATAGRFMTIPKGAAMKRIEIEHIKRMFEAHGYRIVGEGENA